MEESPRGRGLTRRPRAVRPAAAPVPGPKDASAGPAALPSGAGPSGAPGGTAAGGLPTGAGPRPYRPRVQAELLDQVPCLETGGPAGTSTERLFNRLCLNGAWREGDYERYARWYDLQGEDHAARVTVFGLRRSDNPFVKLRSGLSSEGGTALGRVIGLAPAPDSFSLPLDWTLATRTGLSESFPAATLSG